MSSTLTWHPYPPQDGTVLSTGLKFKLRHVFGMEPIDTLFTKKALPVLRALAIGMEGDSSANVSGMVEEVHGIMHGIEKHGSVQLKETW